MVVLISILMKSTFCFFTPMQTEKLTHNHTKDQALQEKLGHYALGQSMFFECGVDDLVNHLGADLKLHLGPLLLTWISNYIHYKVWDEITYPFLNFNGATVEV